MVFSRREFLNRTYKGALGYAGLSLSVAPFLSSCNHEQKLSIDKDSTILFQGDSITDGRRNRKRKEANDPYSFGNSYPFLVACELLKSRPEFELEIYNRGVGGNRIVELKKRWEEDCLDLKPGLVSILIGVNDYWHTLNNRFEYDGTPEIFEREYIDLIEITRSRLPETKILICEPFILPGEVVNHDWMKEFKVYQDITFKIADEFNTSFLPYQAIFNKVTEKTPARHWTRDGIHPTMAGCMLMAEAWLNKVSFL